MEFLNENKLTVEEFLLLHSVYMLKNRNSSEHAKQMQKYYNTDRKYVDKSISFIDIIHKMEKRGLLIMLRPPAYDEENDIYNIKIKDMAVAEKFEEMLFVNVDEMWSMFKDRYPDTYYAAGKIGQAKNEKTGDKEIFSKNILQDGSKLAAQKMLYYVEGMFDWDSRKQEPRKRAFCGLNSFILNWDSYVKQYDKGDFGEDSNEIDFGGSTRL